MKKLLFLFTFLITSFGFAQIASFDSTYIADIKNDLAGTFREVVEDNMKLSEDHAKIFWPLFDKYLTARNPIFEERIRITEDYMINYYGMDDETAKDLLNRSAQLNLDLSNIKKEYLNLMLEQLPAPLVGKFFQIDTRFQALADLVRMSSTPLVRDEE